MRLIILAVSLLAASAAQAQQNDPMLAWSRTLTVADRQVLREAVLALQQVGDPATHSRIGGVLQRIDGPEFGIRDMAFIGMALSRVSKDPQACSLLKRVEPTAICAK